MDDSDIEVRGLEDSEDGVGTHCYTSRGARFMEFVRRPRLVPPLLRIPDPLEVKQHHRERLVYWIAMILIVAVADLVIWGVWHWCL